MNPWANQSNNGRNKIPVGQRHAFDLQLFRQEVTPGGMVSMHSNQAIRATGCSPEGEKYNSDGRSPSVEEHKMKTLKGRNPCIALILSLHKKSLLSQALKI
jgi:hypothetical protein